MYLSKNLKYLLLINILIITFLTVACNKDLEESIVSYSDEMKYKDGCVVNETARNYETDLGLTSQISEQVCAKLLEDCSDILEYIDTRKIDVSDEYIQKGKRLFGDNFNEESIIITVDANGEGENLLTYIKNKQLDGIWSNEEVKKYWDCQKVFASTISKNIKMNLYNHEVGTKNVYLLITSFNYDTNEYDPCLVVYIENMSIVYDAQKDFEKDDYKILKEIKETESNQFSESKKQEDKDIEAKANVYMAMNGRDSVNDLMNNYYEEMSKATTDSEAIDIATKHIDIVTDELEGWYEIEDKSEYTELLIQSMEILVEEMKYAKAGYYNLAKISIEEYRETMDKLDALIERNCEDLGIDK